MTIPMTFSFPGPIFGKELILASRKKRHYVLRSLYVLALLAVVMYYGLTLYTFSTRTSRVSMMSEFGVYLVVTIGVFQFFALQLITPALTGSAISDEIRKQTLPALLMTPLTGFQIVTGKLLSRMFMVLLLVATSFPLLAFVRIFGGVEWHFILALEALTICAAFFAAALSMTFSTLFKKQNHDPAAATYLFLLLVYIVIPLTLYALIDYLEISRKGPEFYYSFFNPFFSIVLLIQGIERPGSAAFVGLSSPFIQCAFLLAGTLLLMILSAALVRRAALKQTEGRVKIPVGPKNTMAKSRLLNWSADRPILWWELRKNLWKTSFRRNLSLILPLVLLIGSYALCRNSLREVEVHIFYVEVFYLLILFQACSVSAPTITREKEANTLELLLTTPLTPREILHQKALGTLPKLLPLIGLMIFHLLLFTVLGILSPFAILQVLVILAGPLVFLIGLGIYLSLRAKLTRNARGNLLGLAFLLWAPCCPTTSLPMLVHLPLNPFFSIAMCLSKQWDLPFSTSRVIHPTAYFLALAGVSFLYAFIGVAFFNQAVRKFYHHTLERNKS